MSDEHPGGSTSLAMWGFPKGKPQVFSSSPVALGASICCYSFGRRLPRWQQALLAAQPLVPGTRSAVITRVQRFEPVCGWEQWADWQRWLRRREARVHTWVHLRSQWGKRRSSLLGLSRTAQPHAFVTIEPTDKPVRHPVGRAVTFRMPLLRDSSSSGSWLLRSFDPVPRFHRTPRWDLRRLAEVANEASNLLMDRKRPLGIPEHWKPMHGDFVPWNLREDRSGRLWLLDWEDAGWGPPFADLVRYAAAYNSIHASRAETVATAMHRVLAPLPQDSVAEAALFWTQHANIGRTELTNRSTTGQTADTLRSGREHDALLLLARRRVPARA